MTHEELTQDINRRFHYHAPSGNQVERYSVIRSSAHYMAKEPIAASWDSRRPDVLTSRELSLALTKLEECVFWANAGIARNRVGADPVAGSVADVSPVDGLPEDGA